MVDEYPLKGGQHGRYSLKSTDRANAMIVKGMPILHARTYNVDFRTGKLLVCPKSFTESEAEFCHRVAQDSTIFFELAPKEGRTVVYGNGKYLIVGKTVVFEDLYKSCGLTSKYVRVDKPEGRFAYGFVGVACAIKDISEPFDISEKTILKIYEHYIADRWDETYGSTGFHESTLSAPIEIEVETLTCQDRSMDSRLQKRNAKIAIEDTAENRSNVIYCVQHRVLKGEKIALCTSFETERAIKESCFDVVTCKGAERVRLNTNVESFPMLSAQSRPTRQERTVIDDLERFNAPKVEPRTSRETVGRTVPPDDNGPRVDTHKPQVSTRPTKEPLPTGGSSRKATSFTEEINRRSAPKINSEGGDGVVSSVINFLSSVVKFLSGKKNHCGGGVDVVKFIGFGAVGALLFGVIFLLMKFYISK